MVKKGFRKHIRSKRIYFLEYDGMDGWQLKSVSGAEGKRIVFVVILFRRFLINDGYFEKDQMKKFLL